VAKPMGLMVAGLNYSNVAADEWNDWYDTEHIPERARIKGFGTIQRWLGADDPKISIATYDLDGVDVLDSPAYKAIAGANMSPWSKRMTGKAERLCRLVAEQIVPGRKAAPLDAGGALLFAMNVKPEAEADFNAWYNDEHLPALATVPGCLCARRFKASGGSHKYVALYHLTGPEVTESKAWENAVNTPWTMKIRPQTSDRLRLVLRRYSRKT
jgi:hypothetical protein